MWNIHFRCSAGRNKIRSFPLTKWCYLQLFSMIPRDLHWFCCSKKSIRTTLVICLHHLTSSKMVNFLIEICLIKHWWNTVLFPVVSLLIAHVVTPQRECLRKNPLLDLRERRFFSFNDNRILIIPETKYFIFTESTPFLGSLIFPHFQSGKMREPGSEVNLKSEIDGIVKLSFFLLKLAKII